MSLCKHNLLEFQILVNTSDNSRLDELWQQEANNIRSLVYKYFSSKDEKIKGKITDHQILQGIIDKQIGDRYLENEERLSK